VPDPLVDAMQSGDRLGYHPETAAAELAHLHQLLPTAQAAVDDQAKAVSARVEAANSRMPHDNPRYPELQAQNQHRLDAMAKAQKLAAEAGK
jgi:hypothetical protein